MRKPYLGEGTLESMEWNRRMQAELTAPDAAKEISRMTMNQNAYENYKEFRALEHAKEMMKSR